MNVAYEILMAEKLLFKLYLAAYFHFYFFIVLHEIDNNVR